MEMKIPVLCRQAPNYVIFIGNVLMTVFINHIHRYLAGHAAFCNLLQYMVTAVCRGGGRQDRSHPALQQSTIN